MTPVALAGLVGLAVSALTPGQQAMDKISCVAAHEAAQEFRQRNLLVQSREQLLLCSDPRCPRLVTEECKVLLAEIDSPPVADDTVVPSAIGEFPASAPQSLPSQTTQPLPAPASVDPPVSETPSPSTTSSPQPSIASGRVAAPIKEASTPSARPAGASRAALVPGTLAVAALVSAAYFGWRGVSGADELSRTCAPDCDPSQVAPIRRQLLIADLSLVAGVGLVTLTAWTVWIGRARETRAAPLASSKAREEQILGTGLSFVPGLGSLRAEYSGRF
jgi:hypothetical protein